MRIVLLSLLLITLFSCKNDSKIPKDVLGEKKMRAVMWDMMRADEWVAYEQSKDSAINRKKRSTELYENIFQINGITAAQFKKNFHYYQRRPDLLKPLLDSLQRKGNKM